MSKHLTGSKRLAVIQRWINGHDDPDWEVFPTRKEGKYIVKKRETPIQKVQESEEENEEIEENSENEEIEKVKTPKIPKKSPRNQVFDQTVNLEILNQLKLLGDEIKRKREKKEQKRMIKEVVTKQYSKPPPPPPPPQQEYYEEPPEQYIPRTRRNHIFDDIC